MSTTTSNNSISAIQQQFWMLNKLEPNNPAYNIPCVFRINGDINVEALNKSVCKLIQRHDALRSNMQLVDSQVRLVIKSEENVAEQSVQLKKIDETLPDKIPEFISADICKPFNLELDDLLRVNLYQYSNGAFFSIVFHHIIIDLCSKDIFADELTQLYNAEVQGEVLPAFSQVASFATFSEWQKEWMRSDNFEKLRGKWKSELDGFEELELPTDGTFTNAENAQGRQYYELSEVLGDKVKATAKDSSITPFVLLLSAYAMFLNRISNQHDIVIGVPLSNRKNADFKDMLGCFVNIVPIRVRFTEDITVEEVFQQVRQAMLKAHRIQEVPFVSIQEAVNTSSELKPLIQAGFTFEPPMQLNLHGVDISTEKYERLGNQLDLFATFWEEQEQYKLYFEYASKSFQSNTIRNYYQVFETIIDEVASNTETTVSDINILPDEHSRLLADINATEFEYNKSQCIHEVFEQRVTQLPNNIALVSDAGSITYSDFNEHVNSLAHYLLQNNVKVGDKVGVCCYRSPEMMIAIYAILKVGAVYVPINPEFPKARIEAIVKDALPQVIFINDSGVQHQFDSSATLCNIENIIQEPLNATRSNPEIEVDSTELAYIIYTSGSTGNPKGVMIEHHSVLNRIDWMHKMYPITSNDVLIQKTSISFDVSVWELFWWAFQGASLVLPKKDAEKEPDTLIKYIREQKVSVIHFVPTMFSYFVNELASANSLQPIQSLKRIFFSGEALTTSLVENFVSLASDKAQLPDLVNLYGPTEATVDVSYYNVDVNNVGKIYIGKPIDNTKLYVINNKHKTQPISIPGELIITGVNLARGYINLPELTAEKFFDFTLPSGELVKAYKTGDLARYDSNGEIDYLGRIDNQVKIRGLRIELGEIESKILEYNGVASAVVVVHGKNESAKLVAYYVAKAEEIDVAALRTYLRKYLPEYMLPSIVMKVDSIPYNQSGKLNRKALPEPVVSTGGGEDLSNATTVEQKILAVWKSLLEINDLGLNDNFFEIGGNSLNAINLAHKISQLFDLKVETLHVFEYPTINKMGAFINEKQNPATESKKEQREELVEKTENRQNRMRQMQDKRRRR